MVLNLKFNDKNIFPKIGMRTVKTGIGVMLSVLFGELGIVNDSIFTVSASVVSMKNTVKSSFLEGLMRIAGTILGGLCGYLMIMYLGKSSILIGLGVIFIIYLCILLRIQDSVAIATLTFASIVVGSGASDPLAYSVGRTFDTLVGVIIALVVNYSLRRKRYIEKIQFNFHELEDLYINLVKDIISSIQYSRLEELSDILTSLQSTHENYIDEGKYSIYTFDKEKLEAILKECEELYYHMYGLSIQKQNLIVSKRLAKELYAYGINVMDNYIISDNSNLILEYHMSEILKIIELREAS